MWCIRLKIKLIYKIPYKLSHRILTDFIKLLPVSKMWLYVRSENTRAYPQHWIRDGKGRKIYEPNKSNKDVACLECCIFYFPRFFRTACFSNTYTQLPPVPSVFKAGVWHCAPQWNVIYFYYVTKSINRSFVPCSSHSLILRNRWWRHITMRTHALKWP